MPFFLTGGVNDREDPTVIGNDSLQEGTGVEYRVGRVGLWSARGRDTRASLSATGRAIHHMPFDGDLDYLLVQTGDNYRTGQIVDGAGISFSATSSAGSNTERLVGTRYAGRHYIVNGVSNRVYEFMAGLGSRSMGMVEPSLTVGVSVTQGSGDMSATTGLIWWATEYDSVRGIESVAGSTSVSSGAFTSKDSVVLSITGTAANSNATHYRIYRSVDDGVFPDGMLIGSVAISSSPVSFTDTAIETSSLTPPLYGTINLGGLDFDRDVAPGALSFVTNWQDSLAGFLVAEPRSLAFTAAGRPESWPVGYRIPFPDRGVGAMQLNGLLGVFTTEAVYRINRYPREVDSAFAAGEAFEEITAERGLISRKGLARFSVPGKPSLLAWVAKDGIWATDLFSIFPLTDGVDWLAHVDPLYLDECSLITDPTERRVIFTYRRPGDTENRGVMYLDYQTEGIRITHPDHGALADTAVAPWEGQLRVFSLDSRENNGGVYTEAVQDIDDSHLVDDEGNVAFAWRTREWMPSGANETTDLGSASIMQSGSAAATVFSEFFYNRFPQARVKQLDVGEREVADFGLTKSVNSFSIRISGSATESLCFTWYEVEPLGTKALGGQEGA